MIHNPLENKEFRSQLRITANYGLTAKGGSRSCFGAQLDSWEGRLLKSVWPQEKRGKWEFPMPVPFPTQHARTKGSASSAG